MGRILTVEQAAEKMQVKPNTIRQWLKQGKIPGRKFGRIYRIPEDELEKTTAGAQVEQPQMDEEARREFVRSLRGKYARLGRTLDDFLAEKQEDIDIEDRRWRETEQGRNT